MGAVFFYFCRDYLAAKLLDSAIDKISDSLSKEHLKQLNEFKNNSASLTRRFSFNGDF